MISAGTAALAWEPEHGLNIVFRDGRTVTRVGPYEGHLTNSSAYGRDDLDDVVYYRGASGGSSFAIGRPRATRAPASWKGVYPMWTLTTRVKARAL